MFRYAAAVLAFIVSLQISPLDDVNSALSQAERLYYDEQFKEAIDLLLPFDVRLNSQPDALQEKIKIKLQIALACIGLSDIPAARSRFGQITDLDPAYSLDPQRYSEKVIALFDE